MIVNYVRGGLVTSTFNIVTRVMRFVRKTSFTFHFSTNFQLLIYKLLQTDGGRDGQADRRTDGRTDIGLRTDIVQNNFLTPTTEMHFSWNFVKSTGLEFGVVRVTIRIRDLPLCYHSGLSLISRNWVPVLTYRHYLLDILKL